MKENNKVSNNFLNYFKNPIKRSKSSNKLCLSDILLNTKIFLINNKKKIKEEENNKKLESLKNLSININNKDAPLIIDSPQRKEKLSIFSNYTKNYYNSNKFSQKNIMLNSASFDDYQKVIIDSKIQQTPKKVFPPIINEEKKNEGKKIKLNIFELNTLTSSSKEILRNSIMNSRNYYFSFKTLSEINTKMKKYTNLKFKINDNKKIYNLSTTKILRDIILNEYNYQDLYNEEQKSKRDFKYYNKWMIDKLFELKKDIPYEEKLHQTLEKEYLKSKYNKPLLNLNSLSVSFTSKGKYHLFHMPFEFLPLFYYKNMSYLKNILISIIKFDNDFEDIYVDYNEINYILSYSKQFEIKTDDEIKKEESKKARETKNKKMNFTSLNFSKVSSKKLSSRKINNKMKGVEKPIFSKYGAFSPKEAFKPNNNLRMIDKKEIQIINNNSHDHTNQDNTKSQKTKSFKQALEKIETNLYKCKYNKFLFKWKTPKYNYDITVKVPEAIFQLGKTTIKTYIDIELIFYLIENNFKNWDFYISQYIFSYKDFQKNMGKLISVKNSADLFPKELDSFPSLKHTLSTKDMKELFIKNKINYLQSEKIHQVSEKSKKYEFIYTDKNNFNYIKIFHNFLIISKCSSLIKNKFYFDFNFFHMKILNRILRIQGLNYFFKKLIYIDKETLSLKFRYDELSSLDRGNYKLLENFEPNINGEKSYLRMNERDNIINFTIIFPSLETIKYNNKDFGDCFESDYKDAVYSGISLDLLNELCKNNYSEWSNLLIKK